MDLALQTVQTILLLTLAAVPGDWLVTTEGERIETRGPWEVEGRRVIFTLPNGTLSVVRLERVDLEASRAASAPPAAPRDEEPQDREAKEPALVLGIGDVARHFEAAAETGEAATAETPASVDLHVASWEDATTPEDRGVRLRGLITNSAETFAASLRLQVTLFDREGQIIDTLRARLARPSLDTQASTSFEAFFPDQYSYDRVQFDLDGRPLLRRDPSVESFDETADAPEAGASPPPGAIIDN